MFQKTNLTVDEALDRFTQGQLAIKRKKLDDIASQSMIHHDELVTEAQTFFKNRGCYIVDGQGQDTFLIDMVAEILCPACNRPVRVAICCGPHTY